MRLTSNPGTFLHRSNCGGGKVQEDHPRNTFCSIASSPSCSFVPLCCWRLPARDGTRGATGYALGHETTDAETNTARAAGRPAGQEASGSFAEGAPGSQVEGQRAA